VARRQPCDVNGGYEDTVVSMKATTVAVMMSTKIPKLYPQTCPVHLSTRSPTLNAHNCQEVGLHSALSEY
jgi:hypothetical protein